MSSHLEQDVRQNIIVALDCTEQEALDLGQQLKGEASWVKIGMTLYYSCGPEIVSRMHELGFKVFLDLKLHDIPHQVAGAAKSAALAGADILSLHSLGGSEMVKAARASIEGLGDEVKTKLVGITVLTSMDERALQEVGITYPTAQEVETLAQLCTSAGAQGLVCSPLEVASIRALVGEDVLIITPGVRPETSATQDQKRTATPREALDNGASMLVIGRPITEAPNPAQAFEEIVLSVSDPKI